MKYTAEIKDTTYFFYRTVYLPQVNNCFQVRDSLHMTYFLFYTHTHPDHYLPSTKIDVTIVKSKIFFYYNFMKITSN